MKWSSLLKEIKDKVGYSSQSQSQATATSTSSAGSGFLPVVSANREKDATDLVVSPGYESAVSSPTSAWRGKHELEWEFKKFWEEFRSSSPEKEKETSLIMAVDAFCKLAKQQFNVAQLVNKLAEAHIFSFVIGRAFVTDVEKLQMHSKGRSLTPVRIVKFFSEVTKDDISPDSNLLYAIEVLVTVPVDKQSLLDSGIFCCLIHILNALLNPNLLDQTATEESETISTEKDDSGDTLQGRHLEVEGRIVHIMKALASHPSAAQSSTEDNSLQILFDMVANGSLKVTPQFTEGLVPLHMIQLHRHAMQILGLLLVNDSGTTTKYIRRHHLIKVLLMAVKEFDPEKGDPSYTMGIVDLLLECVELSYRHEAGHIRLREDIHNAHGYQYFVQFALKLSSLQRNQAIRSSSSPIEDNSHSYDSNISEISTSISPVLSRLLDVLVNLAQTGPVEPGVHENSGTMVKDLEAIQMLQNIFLKVDSVALQAEVLNRMLKLFSAHVENYKICQQLRTVSLFILNMATFPESLQEKILKILEYAVTVANCIPEQELLSLCFLLQQPTKTSLRHTILSFFIKLISFDEQYKEVLREVGVLEVLLDDLKHIKFYSSELHRNKTSRTDSFMKHVDNKDAIISSPKMSSLVSEKLPIFEVEGTISIAWNCLFSMLKKTETNQLAFRSYNGFNILLPLLASETHRPGVLCCVSCLIIEDAVQAHPEELSALVETVKSGMVTSACGTQYKLHDDAKCDTLGSLWHILGANKSSQRVFGEVTGFSLLLTSLHSFQHGAVKQGTQPFNTHMKVFSFLLRVITAGVCNNPINRLRVHAILSSRTFFDLLCECGVLNVNCEKQVIELLFELALEFIVSPSSIVQENISSSATFNVETSSVYKVDIGARVYNVSAIGVLIRSLLYYTSKAQLDLLKFVEGLALASSFNQENLTSIGCIGLLLETINLFISSSSPLVVHALRIVEVLGAYRLSYSELRVLIRHILQMKKRKSGQLLIDTMEKLIQKEDMRSANVALAPFIEVDMRKNGHASIQVSLGERSWPPAAGYSFVCWFQYNDFFSTHVKESEQLPKNESSRRSTSNGRVLRIFSVGAVDDPDTFYAELYLQENGMITLSTSNSSSLSFPGTEIEGERWHHLAVVHSKPSALAGLFQASVANVYVNGKLRHTGRLGYSPSPVGKSLQVTLGTPVTRANIMDLSWSLRSCYLFEEVLTSASICFMYILGRGYRGLFQDTNLVRFVPSQACGGGSMSILDSLDAELAVSLINTQRSDSISRQGNSKIDGSGIVWDLEKLSNISLQLSGKRLIFAFDGTPCEAFRSSVALAVINLVDPMSAAASPIGGIPRFGRFNGDIYICNQLVIGNSIRNIGGIAMVLALVEASDTKYMLHMALELLACALDQSPQNMQEMQALRGYHLLALFLYHKMSLFDMQSLETFFQIAACEASFSERQKLHIDRSMVFLTGTSPESSFENLAVSKFSDELSSAGSHGDLDDFSAQKDSFSQLSELDNIDTAEENTNCIVLSNADMVEHVLLDWTLWVTAPVSVQIALLGFLERLVTMHWYRNHNLTILRKINLVQHLLVTIQRGDVEVPVLEKLATLLGVILEDGFLVSELDLVIRFITMTFDPPNLTSRSPIIRETMGKHVIVRNMLLEMLTDLQVTIKSDELLEQWHKIVSSKLITYFLDEAVHPTSMRWIMTLLGVCLASSPTFVLKFKSSGGYLSLTTVLKSFYDSPEIYYIIFCLMFGKAVYPRVPEVRMLDFHALMLNDGEYAELKFIELIESVIAMVKNTFDRLGMQAMLVYQNGNLSSFSGGLVAELIESKSDMGEDLQGEALMHKTYAARLMGGEAAAPHVATSILRFMVDLAKMCPSFSAICRRIEFLESCVDLYFSCVRADFWLKKAKNIAHSASDEKIVNDTDDNKSSLNASTNILQDQEQSVQTSISIGSFPQELRSTSSENTFGLGKNEVKDKERVVQNSENQTLSRILIPSYSFSSSTVNIPSSPALSDKSISKLSAASASSPVLALTSWLGSMGDVKSQSMSSMSSSLFMNGFDTSPSQTTSSTNVIFPITPNLLLEIDDSSYGGGPSSASATSVLDFIAEILSDIVLEQLKATQIVENILETAPLYADMDSTLVFQGLCLGRLMNFLERRLLRDDEEDERKLDKYRWSLNLESFCWMIVDRVYMGSFPQPITVFRTIEFLISMLQLANKDGRVEEAVAGGKGLLSITRGSKQLESYVHAIMKNTNRMIMYCFLPPSLISFGEDSLVSRLGLQIEDEKGTLSKITPEESGIDFCMFLQLIMANKRLILCPINTDTDVVYCLCINLICILFDNRHSARNMAVDVITYLVLHRRPELEEFLVLKPNQGSSLDIFHGGFDRLISGNLSSFFEWFHKSEQKINKVLEHRVSSKWVNYVSGSTKFPGIRIKGMEVRRKREMGRKLRETSKLELRHWEQMNERRYALELVRDSMSTELRGIRQDKYGWVLHAESEWQTTHLQQLIHERGILPAQTSIEWQLCPIEGPYRMRKKLERCKLHAETIRCVLNSGYETEDGKMTVDERTDKNANTSLSVSDSYDERGFDDDGFILENSGFVSSQSGWNDDQNSFNEQSSHSVHDFGAKSSSYSVPITESAHAQSDLASSVPSSSMRIGETRFSYDKSEKDLHDNGDYLIRPFLAPFEKIRLKYNCERIVGLDKHDGIFLIGDLCLYVIENLYMDDTGCICEKDSEADLSVIDQALGVRKDVSENGEFQIKSSSSSGMRDRSLPCGRAWAYHSGAWGKEKVSNNGNLPHNWHIWKLDNVHELLKRDYQLRPVAVEIFSTDGCNDLLVFHKKEREEVFKNLVAMNLPRNSMLDTTISGSSKQETSEGSRLFKIMTKSFTKRWQSGQISNFQYLMHLNTLAGRGYSDLTQYPVFPWVLSDFESELLDLKNPKTFRTLNKPMGCQTAEGEEEFRKRYESWDDPDVPKFHYGSHYSSAGIVLFYLLRLPPFSAENKILQGGQFDHADRLFNSVKETWLSAAGKGNTSDVKELVPEFFYMPEFLENQFNLDLGVKQSGDKVGDVVLPPWAKGSARLFIQKHREALESDYVSENLHHWIDLIFGYKQRGKAAEDAVNVFYHYTYEGSIDIDSVSDPTMKASILAQINHFGQTPKQLFTKPHVKRRMDRKNLPHPLRYSAHLIPQQIRKSSSSIFQTISYQERILFSGPNTLLKPSTYSKYLSWGFPDHSLRILTYDQDRLLSTHEDLHCGNQIQCTGVSHDGKILVTGGEDGVVSVWRFTKGGVRLERSLSSHTAKITCMHVCQPYSIIVTGSEDATVILWDMTSLVFVKQLPEFPSVITAVNVNELTGEILTASGVVLGVWSINGDCLAVVNASQLPSDVILSVAAATFSDWQEINWYVTGHQSGAVKVWKMVHCTEDENLPSTDRGLKLRGKLPEYRLVLHKALKYHKHPVTALHVTNGLKRQLLSGDSGGNLISWTLPDGSFR